MKLAEILVENTTALDKLRKYYDEQVDHLYIKDLPANNIIDGSCFGYWPADFKNEKREILPNGSILNTETGDVHDDLKQLFGSDGKIKPEFKNSLEFIKLYVNDNCTLDVSALLPGLERCSRLDIYCGEHLSANVIMPNFKGWPKCAKIELSGNHNLQIQSLDGLETTGVKDFSFGIYKGKKQIPSNPLRLLKCQNLETLFVNINVKNDAEDAEITKIFKIIRSHLKDKDIAECSEELIDAGLEEYAKL